MVLDPELLPFLGGPDTANMDDVAGSRRIADDLARDEIASRSVPPEGITIYDDVATDGLRTVPVRIYRQDDQASQHGALLFLHGGAFVFGDLESEHDRCLFYAVNTNCVVIAVDYRLAPEFPYPAGLDDAVLALDWLVTHSDELGIDPQRICVGGASAGGSLAAGLVLRSHENGADVAAQMLIYPVLDDRGTTISMATYDVYDPWDGQRSRKMWPLYLGHDGAAPPYAAAARASDLHGLPTTFLMSCEEDPLRDEELAFAQRLLYAGVSVELHHYAGTYHAFDVIAMNTTVSQRALHEQADFVQRTVGTPSS